MPDVTMSDHPGGVGRCSTGSEVGLVVPYRNEIFSDSIGK
jgi:hypothetical protein